MTTVTEQVVETTETTTTVQTDAVELNQVERRVWEPTHVKGITLSERASDYAARLAELPTETAKGIKYTDKNYFAVVGQDVSRDEVERVEGVNADFVAALHAVASDTFLTRALANKELNEMNVSAKIGTNTTYKDSYSRHDVRTVSQGPDAERKEVETYAYHNASIKTKYKGMHDSQVAVHTLAKDLLG